VSRGRGWKVRELWSSSGFFDCAAHFVNSFAENDGVGGGLLGAGDFFDGGEVAELVVGGEVFDGVGGGLLFVAGGEVGAGDLKAVQEDGGSFGVEVSGGEAGEDVVEGDLDGGSVVNGLHAEHAEAAGERGAREPGAVVVVAEVLGAEGGRAATATVGVDVAAEVAAFGVEVLGGVGVVRVHVGGTPCTLVVKYPG